MKVQMLQYVKSHLAKNRGQHREIAKACGVPYSTIRKISQGVTTNPGVIAVQALYDFFVAGSHK